ncbi:hypothetical protein BD779DRAFT_1492598 [Infundibulicybe gibba]|nr:hypothetical protein BD779DRAFT_1492598 [Infundibulicybe gibba]
MSDPYNKMQVTISLLPVSLSLVHIPRSRLAQLSHPVLRQILQPDPTFLNITCNEIELSIFAEESLLKDFEPLALRDQQSRSGSGADGRVVVDESWLIEISQEKWSVLQIDSHSDQLDSSGARVNELSALLAAAGISILYQSSYMSQELHLQEAMSLFDSSGYDLYYPDPNFLQSHTPSPLSSPLSEGQAFMHNISSITTSGPIPGPVDSSSANGVPRVNTDAAGALHTSAGQVSPRQKSHSPTSGEVNVLHTDLTCVGLSDELGIDHWGLKIVKLVAFPDLIPRREADGRGPARTASTSSSDDENYFSHSPLTEISSIGSTPDPPHPQSRKGHTHTTHTGYTRHNTTRRSEFAVPFFTFTRTIEGSSLTTDATLLAALFPPHERHMVICNEDESEGIDHETTLKCLQIDLRRFGWHGLVNRFSRVLEENCINHMYSSTFKTANLLVGKKDVVRAQALLRAC